MDIKVKRIEQGKYSILSEIYVNDRFFGYGLEDSAKDPESTGPIAECPAGRYSLALRIYGALHARYARRFAKIHKGVLHIPDSPRSKYAYIRVGRDFGDAEGGILLGQRYKKDKMGDYELQGSAKCYRKLYPKIVSAMQGGRVILSITEDLPTGKKKKEKLNDG